MNCDVLFSFSDYYIVKYMNKFQFIQIEIGKDQTFSQFFRKCFIANHFNDVIR